MIVKITKIQNTYNLFLTVKGWRDPQKACTIQQKYSRAPPQPKFWRRHWTAGAKSKYRYM